MSLQHETEVFAAAAMVEQITSIERKIGLMKQYINPRHGLILDAPVVRNLYTGADDCMKTVGDLLLKFE